MPKRRKVKLKDKLWNKFIFAIIDILERLPEAKKGVVSWLQNVRQERVSFKNEKPDYIDISLQSIWVCYLVPIEDFHSQTKAVIQILNEFKTKRFLDLSSNKNRELIDTLNKFKDGVYGTSWHNIGLLDFINSDAKNDIDYAHLEIQALNGSFVSLVFNIKPTTSFLNRVHSIVRRNVAESLEIYPPRNFKNLLRGWWGGKTQNESHYKLQLIQNEIHALKDSFTRIIKQFFSGYFMKQNDMIPSFELWTHKQTYCSIIGNDKIHERMFWDSLGMDNNSHSRYSTLSYLETIFWPERYQNDLSIKYLVNTDFKTIPSGHSSVESKIEHSTNFWVPSLLSTWAFRFLILDLNEVFLNLRLNLYRLLKKRYFNNPIKYAEAFLKQKTLLNRISYIFQKESLQRRFIHSGFPEFKNEKKRDETYLQLLTGNTDFLKKESFNLLKENQEVLDATINAKVIKTNLRVQDYILLLTLITTGIMIYDKTDEFKKWSAKFVKQSETTNTESNPNPPNATSINILTPNPHLETNPELIWRR